MIRSKNFAKSWYRKEIKFIENHNKLLLVYDVTTSMLFHYYDNNELKIHSGRKRKSSCF